MKKEDLLLERDSVSNMFSNLTERKKALQKETIEIDTEIVKTQGEYRVLSRLIEDLESSEDNQSTES